MPDQRGHKSGDITHVFPPQDSVTYPTVDISNGVLASPHIPIFRFTDIYIDTDEVNTKQDGKIKRTETGSAVPSEIKGDSRMLDQKSSTVLSRELLRMASAFLNRTDKTGPADTGTLVA